MTDQIEPRPGLPTGEEQEPESGFITDQPAVEAPPDAGTAAETVVTPALPETPAGATVVDERAPAGAAPGGARGMTSAAVAAGGKPDLSVLDVRPAPGPPRDYHFPRFERHRLDNGLTVIEAHIPGRPLLAAALLLEGGGAIEPASRAGVSVLAARALTEGTERRDAIDFIEAGERLGAELHAEAGWENVTASLEVPRSRFPPAVALLAEMVLQPAFPANEVERLRDERLNDLLQARADPRRRAERIFPETIYAARSPYSRPLAGIEETVADVGRDAVVEQHRAWLRPEAATLIVAGDLRDLPVTRLAAEHLGTWRADSGARVARRPTDAAAHEAGSRIVVVDRPGSPQSEVRIGHVGVPRKIADFHAVSVLNTLLGGTFGSRLNRLIREERGYTYGIHSTFEMRRSAGPFAVRTAVQTEVTVPAIMDTVAELRRVREAEVEPEELDHARDYLVGVFPLRFEASAQVAAAIGGLVALDLPDDELDRYRPGIASVGASDVLEAARRHIRPHEASIVVVGDASRFADDLEAAGLGTVERREDRLTPVPA